MRGLIHKNGYCRRRVGWRSASAALVRGRAWMERRRTRSVMGRTRTRRWRQQRPNSRGAATVLMQRRTTAALRKTLQVRTLVSTRQFEVLFLFFVVADIVQRIMKSVTSCVQRLFQAVTLVHSMDWHITLIINYAWTLFHVSSLSQLSHIEDVSQPRLKCNWCTV